MRRYHRPRPYRRALRHLRLLLAAAAAVLTFIVLDIRLRPVITTMAQYQCRVVSVLAMNEAVIEALQQDAQLSKDLVAVRRADDGTVRSIEVDSTRLNLLKADLTDAVSQRLLLLEEQDVHIPLGTLLGWQLLAGRGPDIHLQVLPASFVQATTVDKLETAGINQTQHRVFIRFEVEMSAILPGYTTEITVESEVCVAETLIVGQVPQFYAVTQS